MGLEEQGVDPLYFILSNSDPSVVPWSWIAKNYLIHGDLKQLIQHRRWKRHPSY